MGDFEGDTEEEEEEEAREAGAVDEEGKVVAVGRCGVAVVVIAVAVVVAVVVSLFGSAQFSCTVFSVEENSASVFDTSISSASSSSLSFPFSL